MVLCFTRAEFNSVDKTHNKNKGNKFECKLRTQVWIYLRKGGLKWHAKIRQKCMG